MKFNTDEITALIDRLENSEEFSGDSAVPQVALDASETLRQLLQHMTQLDAERDKAMVFVTEVANLSMWDYDNSDGKPYKECPIPSDGFLDSHCCLMELIAQARRDFSIKRGRNGDGSGWTNYYLCPCGEAWDDQHDTCCNDRCGACNKEIEPYISDDGSVSDDKIETARQSAMQTMNLVEIEVNDDTSVVVPRTPEGLKKLAGFASTPQEIFGYAASLGGIYCETGDEDHDQYSFVDADSTANVIVTRATLEVEIVY